jgi:peptidoglycan/LPS O-acetylase OafA/YrhL
LIKQSHSNNFHFLRHIAAFLVLYSHCHIPGDTEWVYRFSHQQLELSSTGVSIFFILSGFLVTQSLWSTQNTWIFLQKRWWRIWPALASVTLLLVFLVAPLISTFTWLNYMRDAATWRFLFSNLLFIPRYFLPGVWPTVLNSTFWTIFYEVACYLVLAFLGRAIIRQKSGKWLLLAAILLASIISAFGVSGFWQPYHYGVFTMMKLFFMGAGWWMLVQKFNNTHKLLLPAIFLFLAAAFIPMPRIISIQLQELSLLVWVLEFGRAPPIISWPGWDISYGLYLVAWPVQVLLMRSHPIFMHTWPLLGSCLLISILLAFASWYGIEKPALRRKPGRKAIG